MPSSIVKSFAAKSGKSVADVEKLWDKAKKVAANAGRKEDYPYITGILKKMLKLESFESTNTDTNILIDLVLQGKNPQDVIASAYSTMKEAEFKSLDDAESAIEQAMSEDLSDHTKDLLKVALKGIQTHKKEMEG